MRSFTGINCSFITCLKRLRLAVAWWYLRMVIICYFGSAYCMAQEGFVSVDCGASPGKYTDSKTMIEWVSDVKASFLQSEAVSVARAVQAPAGNGARRLSSVRYFPGEQSKYCYVFSQNDYDFIQQGSAFLVRATFWGGDLNIFTDATTASFQLLINADVWDSVSITLPQADVVVKEAYMLPTNSSPASISVCLASRGLSIPFISSLELRVLPLDFYSWYLKSYRLPIHVVYSVNYGASTNDAIRYPDDPMDRIWQPDISQQPGESTTREANNWQGLSWASPPRRVLQTSYVADEQIRLSFEGLNGSDTYFVAEYLFDPLVISTGQRVFTWQTTGYGVNSPVDLSSYTDSYTLLYSGKDSPLTADTDGQLVFNLTKTPNSTYGPLISALQLFRDFGATSPGSNSYDVDAIKFIQTNYFTSLTTWTGDPCLPYSYNWLNCTDDQSPTVLNLLLSNRSLEGAIPSRINSLQSLVGIFLDHNKLSGSIPTLSNLEKLQILDLSNNNLNGTIPTFLADLPSLTTLLLDNNSFIGKVPQEILEKFSGSNLKFSFSGNPLLCTDSNCPPNQGSKTSKKSDAGLVAGLVSGLVATILIVIVLVIICLKRRHGKRRHRLLTRVGKTKECTSFTYSEVKAITNNFRKQLGVGGFGPVYYGELPDQRPVAVKVLSAASHQGEREFLNEVDLLSRVHHKSLVTLLGYCVEENLVLIYEYMVNGSLVQALQGKCSILNTWKDYLRVAVDAAEGLEYLHNGCNPQIIHRDVKSSNILLSQEMRGKLSDFGISRSKVSTIDGTEMFTVVQGSMGYIDPEYAESHMVTQKIDVYAFGVVLLEICTGRSVLSQQADRQPQHLADWVKFHVERGNIHSVLRSSFDGRYNVSAAWKVVDVAMRCVEFESKRRPNMNEVCSELKSALEIELQGEQESNTTFTITSSINPR